MSKYVDVIKVKESKPIVQVMKGKEGSDLRAFGHVTIFTPKELGISDSVHDIDVSGSVDTVANFKNISEIDVGSSGSAGHSSWDGPTYYIGGIERNTAIDKISNHCGKIKNIRENSEIKGIYNSGFGEIWNIEDNKLLGEIFNGAILKNLENNKHINLIYNYGKAGSIKITEGNIVEVLKNSNHIESLEIDGNVDVFYSRKPLFCEVQRLKDYLPRDVNPDNIDGSFVESIKVGKNGVIRIWAKDRQYPFKVGEIEISEGAKIHEPLLEYLLKTQEVGSTYGVKPLNLSEKDRYSILETPAKGLANVEFEFLKKKN